ncbi:VTT domain-containing protein [Patescibacteria group bacterium]|nr:VTT domain-containing protein [Patescibacteria group bacterium]
MSYIDLIFRAGPILAYVFIFIIIFAECGLFIGFFLPGDSLLLPLGLLASQGKISVVTVILLASIASFLGNWVGYWFGKRVGPALFSRPDSRFFKQKNLRKAHTFYEKYGAKTIFLARFVPVVRTFAPIVAGIGEMRYHTFTIYNAVSGVIWVCAVTLAGYFLGNSIPNIDHYILLIVALIIVASVVPILFHLKSSRGKADHV